MKYATQVTTWIDQEVNRNGLVSFWAIMKFANELDPALRLKTEGEFIDIRFTDGSAVVTYMVTEDADSPDMIWVSAVRDWSNSWEQNSEWIAPGTSM